MPYNNTKLYYCDCGKKYKHNSSLCLHKNKCNKKIADKELDLNINYNEWKIIIMTIFEQNKAILLENKKINKLLKEAMLKINSL
jgi:hypothetical protein